MSDTVFLDDSNPLTGFMLIDTAIWGEDGNFIDAVAHMISPFVLRFLFAGGHCGDTLGQVLGRYIRTARKQLANNPHAGDYIVL